MTEELVIEIMMLTLKTMGMLSAPMIITVMAVGIIAQILQTVTQMKDQALSFVPKVIAAGAVFVVCIPWYIEVSRQYTEIIFNLMSRAAE